MYVKGKPPIVPSDAQSKEKLAIHVYEYLIHIGAQKSANSFLQEIRWDKPIPIGEPPGFLHSWWSVFWDLYSAAPERRDNHDHSNEAKAFHDYGFVNSGFTNGMPHPNHPGMPQGPSGPMGPPNPMDCGQPPMLRGQPSGNNPGNQPPRGLVMSPMHPHHPGMRFPPGMHPGMRPGPPAQRWPPVVVGGGGPSHPGGHSMVGPIPPNQGPPSGHPGLPPHPSNPQNMPNNPHISQSNQIVPSPGHPITPGSNNAGGNNQPPGTHPMMLPPSPNTNPDVFNSQQPNSNNQINNMPPGGNNQNSNTPPTHGNISGSPYAANRPSPHIDGFNNLNNNQNVNNNGNNNGPNSDNMMNNPMNGRMMPPPPNNDYMDSLKASPHLNINNSSDQQQQIPNNNPNSNPNDFVNGQGSLPTSQQMDSNNYSNSNTPNNNGPQSSQPPPTSASQNGVPSVQFPHEYSFNQIT